MDAAISVKGLQNSYKDLRTLQAWLSIGQQRDLDRYAR